MRRVRIFTYRYCRPTKSGKLLRPDEMSRYTYLYVRHNLSRDALWIPVHRESIENLSDFWVMGEDMK